MVLATRIIPVLLADGGALVKGKQFGQQRIIGHVRQAARVYDMRQCDELIVLDVTATTEDRGPDFDLVRDLASECFMPLTVGGGVRTLDHFKQLINGGADKVAINSAAIESPSLVREAAEKFGRQAVVVSIDVR